MSLNPEFGARGRPIRPNTIFYGDSAFFVFAQCAIDDAMLFFHKLVDNCHVYNQQLAIFVNDLEEMLHGGRIIV
jgi:hypothetical protein